MKGVEGVVSAEIFVSVSEGQTDEMSYPFAKRADLRYVGAVVVGDACQRRFAKFCSYFTQRQPPLRSRQHY
jgi:hypothetical protein